MITFSILGRKGNLGNQLFQIASTIGIAKKNHHSYIFPLWSYATYFENKIPMISELPTNLILIREEEFTYHEWPIGDDNYDLHGWLQTEKYFDIALTKKYLEFEVGFKANVLNKFKTLFERKTILISVRRGDFVGNPNFHQISYKYYFLALLKNFPDWKDRNIIFMSDDISYCKHHFSFIKHSFFLENLNPLEQMVIGTACNDFIISNSTFSWWVAWLGERSDSKIICPIKNLRGEFGRKNNDIDYYPKRWIKFDDQRHSIQLQFVSLIFKGEIYRYESFIKVSAKHLKTRLKKEVKKVLGK